MNVKGTRHRTIVGFVISVLVLVSLAVWAFKGHFSGSLQEILMVGGGILSMAVAFLLCWLGVKLFRMKNA